MFYVPGTIDLGDRILTIFSLCNPGQGVTPRSIVPDHDRCGLPLEECRREHRINDPFFSYHHDLAVNRHFTFYNTIKVRWEITDDDDDDSDHEHDSHNAHHHHRGGIDRSIPGIGLWVDGNGPEDINNSSANISKPHFGLQHPSLSSSMSSYASSLADYDYDDDDDDDDDHGHRRIDHQGLMSQQRYCDSDEDSDYSI